MKIDAQPRTAEEGQARRPRLGAYWIAWATIVILIMILPGGEARKIKPAAPSVTLALLGDLMLGRSVRPTSETFSYLEPFLMQADLTLANLESPLTDSPVETESPYALCAPPANVEYLADAGFDLLALSNNHSLDCGVDGLIETRQTLSNAGLGFISADPVYYSFRGIKLAFVAFDATTDFNLEGAVRAIQSARETEALVVVSMHWGAEYQNGASTSQKEIAEKLAEAGAALIWGHHPHVLQPAEWIEGCRTLVFYSLGNALFDQYGLEDTRRSALLLVTLDAQGVEDFRAVPFLIDVAGSRIQEPDEADVQLIGQYFRR